VTEGANPIIIGLAGGVGSGKSAVARELAQLGFLVLDFDALAREALDRSEVRATLAQWWGTGVLRGSPERVDRGAVARIVFADDSQRRRLEALIHPLIKPTRAQALALLGSTAPAPAGLVLDAPLLFEAGLDAICDAVVFVEAPRAVRLERVRRERGWDEAELDRRDAAQWPLDRKRAACRHIIRNDHQDSADLTGRVAALCATLGQRSSGGGGG